MTAEGEREPGALPAAQIVRLRAWDATPVGATAVKWSELSAPVRPAQFLVTVEIERAGERVTGVAAATRYLAASEPIVDLTRAEFELRRYVDHDPMLLAVAGNEWRNPYEPSLPGLPVLVELACLDAIGRLAGLPATAFLGGTHRSEVPAYASLPSFADPEEALECARASLARGFRAVKFHASGEPSCDVETIRRAGEEIGASAELIWDGSCAYDFYGAVAVGRALEAAGFVWFEAPMTDAAGPVLADLSRRLQIPLIPDATASFRAAGEWANDLAAGTWAGLRVDVTRVTSVADAVRLVRMAEAFGKPCEIQSFGYPLAQLANLSLIMATRACRYFEAPFPETDLADELVPAPILRDGCVRLPDAPGLGHGVDGDEVAASCQLLVDATVAATQL